MTNECGADPASGLAEPGGFVAVHLLNALLDYWILDISASPSTVDTNGVEVMTIVILDEEDELVVELVVPADAGQAFQSLFNAYTDFANAE